MENNELGPWAVDLWPLPVGNGFKPFPTDQSSFRTLTLTEMPVH